MPHIAAHGGSIANRVFVMILGGIILATVVTTWLAASDRKQAIEEIRDMHTAERVEQLVLALEKVDAMLRPVILQAAASFGVEAKFVDASREPALIAQANRAELNNLPLQALLKTRLGGNRHVGTQREPGCAPRSTRDGGAGIPADRIDAVFDSFFRLEISRSRDTGGTGLGLTIARNIAENHGGSLTLANHPEGGLEAIVSLPIKSAGEKKPA
ncbi:MAG: hypothetical protein H7244_05635 [Herminiimonas sp.]|nr:hypothetical protein [Herminiimonas sp.]